ncbi:MAG TPA: GntR family transcriptional regulator, partial [Verrucomicrobiales bacterium]|nr:GntR family transcriptional regulator [Verrucomicrobiales bacterium]
MTRPKPASASPLTPRTKRPGDTADRIYRRLVEAILAGRFAAGEVLREAALARDWGVSRTPLREAVRRAAETGLVILRPNNAPLVCSLNRRDVASLYVLRENLELLALKLAWGSLQEQQEQLQTLQALAEQAQPGSHRDWPALCLQFDRELHSWWTEACANPWLESTLRRLARFLAV